MSKILLAITVISGLILTLLVFDYCVKRFDIAMNKTKSFFENLVKFFNQQIWFKNFIKNHWQELILILAVYLIFFNIKIPSNYYSFSGKTYCYYSINSVQDLVRIGIVKRGGLGWCVKERDLIIQAHLKSMTYVLLTVGILLLINKYKKNNKKNSTKKEIESKGENLVSSLEKKIDRDKNGAVLPTAKNKEFSEKISKEYKVLEKMPSKLRKDFLDISKADLFDSRKSNVFFDTPEKAIKAGKRAELTNKLDNFQIEKFRKTGKNNFKIMQFENDPMLREIFKKKFLENSFQIKQFSHPGKNVIEEIKSYNPDLIITEIVMPEMDGIEFIEKVRQNKNFNNIRIAVYSNMGEKDCIEKALKLGADDYWVSCHFTPNEIINEAKKLLNNKNKIPSKIDISKIKSDFGESNERKDEELIRLLSACYKKELTCRRALIKSEFIKPFTDYKPVVDESLKKYFTENFKNKNYSELTVYQKGKKFIMSDDYYTYYFYKEAGCTNIPCLVLGEIKEKIGIVKIAGEPFYLKPPTAIKIVNDKI